jgi:putative Mn2+ efflux pump MntP
MLLEGIRNEEEEEESSILGMGVLFVQGVATSIDALSVGFTIADYNWMMAVVSALIIAVVTFIISVAGLVLGKKFGTRLSNKASILGGVILIGIGLEIFISSWL